MNRKEALKKAVRVIGTQSGLADVCGKPVTQSHVYNWLNRDSGLPPQYAMRVFRACLSQGDPVYPWELCPEVFAVEDFGELANAASA
jgi:hypothetical protein